MKPLILIIEDDATFRSILFELLELEDYNVVSAENGFLGLQLAQTLQPNLILSDINMPKLDGYGVLKKLRGDLTTAKIPFIFLTAQTDSINRHQAMQLGANDYLIKPVSYGQLVIALQNQLQPTSGNFLPKLQNLPKVESPAS